MPRRRGVHRRVWEGFGACGGAPHGAPQVRSVVKEEGFGFVGYVSGGGVDLGEGAVNLGSEAFNFGC